MSLLGIDIGTTGCKAIVFRVDGQALAHAYREYPLIHPREGWAELNPETVWACVSEAVAEAVDRAGPGDPVKALGTSVQGEAVTPVIHGESLLLNWDQEGGTSALICLDAATGQDRWRAPRDERSTWNTPLVVEYKGQIQVIVNGNNRIRAHDFATGREIWQCGGIGINPIPSPVTDGDVVYCMSGYTNPAARAIRLGGTGDLTESAAVVWKLNRGTPYVPSPLLLGDRLYFTKGREAILTIVDTRTGRPVLNEVRLAEANSFYASPVAAAGRVYLVDRGGTTLVLKQSDKLEILATNRLDDPMDASPVVVGRQLFLRGAKNLYCIEE